MAKLLHQDEVGGQGRSLQALLDILDRETASELALDRALLQERAARKARKKKPHIAFLLGRDEMALAIDAIQEIGPLPTVTPLPHLPPWIRGIVQIRGEILSVVDLLVRFSLRQPGASSERNQSFVIFRQQELKFCLVVDRITGVVNLDGQRDRLAPHSPEESGRLAQLTTLLHGVLTIDRRSVSIFDSKKLASSPLIRQWH